MIVDNPSCEQCPNVLIRLRTEPLPIILLFDPNSTLIRHLLPEVVIVKQVIHRVGERLWRIGKQEMNTVFAGDAFGA